jgi:hypothetical protein
MACCSMSYGRSQEEVGYCAWDCRRRNMCSSDDLRQGRKRNCACAPHHWTAVPSLGTRRHQGGHPPWLPSIPGDDHAGSRTSHPKTAPVVYPSAAYQQHRPGACAALIAVISLAASPATAITPPTCLLPTPARHHGRPRPARAEEGQAAPEVQHQSVHCLRVL